MSPNPSGTGLVRSAAVVNEDIRALWPHPVVRLTDEERAAWGLAVAGRGAVS